MNLEMTTHDGVPVAALVGRLDLRGASEFRLQVAAAIAAAADRLVLDLSDVEFIDSSGLGVLAGLHREAERHGTRMAIVVPRGSAGQIFALTRTEGFFHLVPTLEDSHAAFGT